MKKKNILVPAIFGLICLSLVMIHLVSLDGLDGIFCSMLFEDDTQFTPGYTASKFRSISVGMTEGEVLDRLGHPIEIWAHKRKLWIFKSLNDFTPKPGEPYSWRYSRSPSYGSLYIREINFKDGLVTDKFSEFYVD